MTTFIKYPKIKTLGDRDNEGILTTPGVYSIQEKVDGANFGFYVEGDTIYFCSRNQNLTDSKQMKTSGVPKKWLGIEPVYNAFIDHPERFRGDLYVYGESMQKHRMTYDCVPGFLGYDVFHLEVGEYLHWITARMYIESLGLEYIHVYGEIKIPDGVSLDYLKSVNKTSAYREGAAEGIVIKRYDTQQAAKIVDDTFRESVKPPREHANSQDEELLSETYATDARIEKIIYKLRDDGNEISMTMMSILFGAVVDDIMEEEGDAISEAYPDMVKKTLDSMVAKKCSVVLKDVIMRHA